MKKDDQTAKTQSWSEIKDEIYGIVGSERRDELERESESFRIGLMLRQAREKQHMTQEDLAILIDKKRPYI